MLIQLKMKNIFVECFIYSIFFCCFSCFCISLLYVINHYCCFHIKNLIFGNTNNNEDAQTECSDNSYVFDEV